MMIAKMRNNTPKATPMPIGRILSLLDDGNVDEDGGNVDEDGEREGELVGLI